jgi:hypothetical protein
MGHDGFSDWFVHAQFDLDTGKSIVRSKTSIRRPKDRFGGRWID